MSALEGGLWRGVAPLLLAAVQEVRGLCCSSSRNYGAMLVWRGPVPTLKSRNGSWTAAREPQVWTLEVIDPPYCKRHFCFRNCGSVEKVSFDSLQVVLLAISFLGLILYIFVWLVLFGNILLC